MTTAGLLARAQALTGQGGRRMLGITGAPGAGKSTLAQALAAHLGACAVVVAMDGFHLAQDELVRLGRAERKGAPDTFDADGYIALLRRLREARATVYAPRFSRDLDEPIAGAVAVAPHVELVITEGNYLLLDGVWRAVRQLLDEVAYLEVDEAVRIAQLSERHVRHGRSPAAARRRAIGSDQDNALLVAATRPHADLVVRGSEASCPDRTA